MVGCQPARDGGSDCTGSKADWPLAAQEKPLSMTCKCKALRYLRHFVNVMFLMPYPKYGLG